MSDREHAREEAIKLIRKEYGKEAILKMSDSPRKDIDVIPTGSIGLDIALGVGGYPRGRVIEVFGPEASGKTTMTLHAIAECQKMGGTCAFIDAEHAMNVEYARALGVDIDGLILSQPDYGEQGLTIVERLVDSDAFDMIVIDSVANLTPKAELEGEMVDHSVGVQARLMSKALRKLTSKASRSRTVLFFINQLRSKIGVMYGSNETTTGGNALKFYSSVRLDVRRVGKLESKGLIIGHKSKITVVKNKVGPPFRKAEFEMLYPTEHTKAGINYLGEIVDYGVQLSIINRSGAWYSLGDQKLGQGKDSVVKYLQDNPDFCANIEAEIRKQYGLE